jgi:hypothetical protein
MSELINGFDVKWFIEELVKLWKENNMLTIFGLYLFTETIEKY